jgi:hypothetical protein
MYTLPTLPRAWQPPSAVNIHVSYHYIPPCNGNISIKTHFFTLHNQIKFPAAPQAIYTVTVQTWYNLHHKIWYLKLISIWQRPQQQKNGREDMRNLCYCNAAFCCNITWSINLYPSGNKIIWSTIYILWH